MKKTTCLSACLLAMAFSAGTLAAAEKSVMHCFAFTPVETASQSDWDAFYKATNALPGKIKGLKRAWAGKLARPLNAQPNPRQYGACMEFESEAAYKAYGQDPAHTSWVDVYGKVRVPGTTTFQILSQ